MGDFQNEDGEFLMTATELRTEWELDALSAQERADEAWLDSWDDEGDECDIDYDLDAHDGHAWCWTHDQNADKCEVEDNDSEWFMEDQHIDGMWEE